MNEIDGLNVFQRDDIPNVIIVQYENDELHALKFIYNDGDLEVMSAQLTTQNENSGIPYMEPDQICFARIAFEFELDSDEGLMEISLHETVHLHSDGEPLNSENLLKTNIEELTEIYIEHIETFYNSFDV